ncbi:MAG TPA: hypothetical protein PLC19_05760 [Marmoricola sp.]|nr:hypothetical protein [Marmoricola sp.]HNO39159.1 hypothetical protein [Marmoricola sp.]
MIPRSVVWLLGYLIGILTIGLAAPAQASEQINFSTDGVSWSPTPPTLFPGVNRMAPGDSVTSELWVSNGSNQAAWFQILADIRLADHLVPMDSTNARLELRVTDPSATTSTTTFRSADLGSECINFVTRRVPSGGTRQIITTVSLPWHAGNELQTQELLVPMSVRASALKPPAGSSDCLAPPTNENIPSRDHRATKQQTDEPLPETGSGLSANQTLILISLSGLLIYLGIIAISTRDQEPVDSFRGPTRSIGEKI